MPKRVTKCKFCGKDLESWQYSYCDDVCRRAFYTTPELRVKPVRVFRETGLSAKYKTEPTEYQRLAAGSREMSIVTGKKKTTVRDVIRIQRRGWV